MQKRSQIPKDLETFIFMIGCPVCLKGTYLWKFLFFFCMSQKQGTDEWYQSKRLEKGWQKMMHRVRQAETEDVINIGWGWNNINMFFSIRKFQKHYLGEAEHISLYSNTHIQNAVYGLMTLKTWQKIWITGERTQVIFKMMTNLYSKTTIFFIVFETKI